LASLPAPLFRLFGVASDVTALARLEKLPDWPARMTAPVAAAYMGDSANCFTEKYAAYGRREGGKVYWSRAQLDILIAQQFELGTLTRATAPMDSDYDQWKAGRREK